MTAKELGSRPAGPVEVKPTYQGLGHVRTGNDSYLEHGLTKREYFAGLAMLGLISGETEESHFGHISGLTEKAAELADALLEELAKEK